MQELQELRNTMCVSGAATSTTHHCLQGGGGWESRSNSWNGSQHQTGNIALVSDWEGCWEGMDPHGHAMGLTALEAEVFYFYF